jgi:hypothetical protein
MKQDPRTTTFLAGSISREFFIQDIQAWKAIMIEEVYGKNMPVPSEAQAMIDDKVDSMITAFDYTLEELDNKTRVLGDAWVINAMWFEIDSLKDEAHAWCMNHEFDA